MGLSEQTLRHSTMAFRLRRYVGSLQGDAIKASALTTGGRDTHGSTSVLRMTGQLLVSSALTWHLKRVVLLRRDIHRLNDSDRSLFSVTPSSRQWEAVPHKAPLNWFQGPHILPALAHPS